jgi:hypothetical protein
MDKDFELIQKRLRDYCTKYGFEVVSEMLTRLKNKNKYATGNLMNSIEYKIVDTKDEIGVEFTMDEYGLYVDKGVNGTERRVGSPYSYTTKMPPVGKLQEWCRIKGIPIKAAYPIAKMIQKKGFTPTNFWTFSTSRRQKQFLQMIEKITANELTPTLKKFFGEK